MGYGLIQLVQNFAQVPRSPDQYAHGFSLAVGELTTEPGFISGDFTGFFACSFRKILRKLTLHLILITPPPIAEFRLHRQADSDPLADFKRASLCLGPAIKRCTRTQKTHHRINR